MHVYVLTNAVNGKRYVGQTVRTLDRRLYEHGRASTDTHIARAIRKHGWENFSCTSCQLDSLSELNELEEFAVKVLGSHVSQHGYNAKRGGANHYGQPITKETRKKISKALTGRPVSEETRRRISEANKLVVRTPERAAKQAASLRGRKMPQYQRDKISAALRGRVHSPETRAKISAANKGKKRSQEIVDLYRRRQTGKTHSEETRARMSASHRKRQELNPCGPRPEETKAKISEGLKRHFAMKRGN